MNVKSEQPAWARSFQLQPWGAGAGFRFEKASQRDLSSSTSSLLSTRTGANKSNRSPQDFRIIEDWLIIAAVLYYRLPLYWVFSEGIIVTN
jgi:hypothetical protein